MPSLTCPANKILCKCCRVLKRYDVSDGMKHFIALSNEAVVKQERFMFVVIHCIPNKLSLLTLLTFQYGDSNIK